MHIAIEIAGKQLERFFNDKSIMVIEHPIKIVENQEVSLIEMLGMLVAERKKFDDLLNRNEVLNFMKDGSSGRIQFKVIPSTEEDNQDTLCFTDLERAPIIDINKRLFRRSFQLSLDYKLLGNTCLFGYSPKEELSLFANKLLFDRNPLEAVVSLLTTRYTGTAFRVSPTGGLLTCHHNLSFTDNGPVEELWINPSVYSQSLEYAGTSAIKVQFHSCKLPNLGEDAKDPLDGDENLTISLKHSDIAFLSSPSEGPFLIPYANTLSKGEAVVCIGYPGKIDTVLINEAYTDILACQVPDLTEYQELFKVGHLSVSPGPLLDFNSNAIAYAVATIPGFSGSPVCLLGNPRMFIGVHYRARHGKDYALSTSVKDKGFYELYSTCVVPELRKANLCPDDIKLVNDYLCLGTTPLLREE